MTFMPQDQQNTLTVDNKEATSSSRQKERILILIDWFWPGYKAGGPIQSTSNLAWALNDHYDFAVITTDTDHTSKIPYDSVKSDSWQEFEGIPVYYFSKRKLGYKKLYELIQETPFDYVYLNSMYSLPFTIWPLWMKLKGLLKGKLVLAPRGMLQAGALAIKTYKKLPFLKLVKWSGVPQQIIWHATDQQEAEDIALHFGEGLDIRVASNIPKQQQLPWEQIPKVVGEAKFVFNSRISKKKNLEFFLRRLKKVEGKVVLDVFGPKEDGAYWRLVQQTATALPSNCKVNFKGAVPQLELQQTIRDYHFSVLTTHGENFGHAIFEGFLAGNPGLISNLTPWQNLEVKKMGWDLPLEEPERFEEAIQTCIDMDQEKYDEWSKASWDFAAAFKRSPKLLKQTKAVFA